MVIETRWQVKQIWTGFEKEVVCQEELHWQYVAGDKVKQIIHCSDIKLDPSGDWLQLIICIYCSMHKDFPAGLPIQHFSYLKYESSNYIYESYY